MLGSDMFWMLKRFPETRASWQGHVHGSQGLLENRFHWGRREGKKKDRLCCDNGQKCQCYYLNCCTLLIKTTPNYNPPSTKLHTWHFRPTMIHSVITPLTVDSGICDNEEISQLDFAQDLNTVPCWYSRSARVACSFTVEEI